MSAKPMNRGLAILAATSVFAMIAWNYLANTGQIYGLQIGEVSDAYRNLFTPAGYTFSIWGIIYIGMIAIAVGLISGKGGFEKLGNGFAWLIIAQSFVNSLWIHFFLSGGLLASVFELFFLFVIVFMLMSKVAHLHTLQRWVQITLGIYAGWVTAASIAGMALYLTFIEWEGWGLSELLWYRIMTITAAIIGFLVVQNKKVPSYGLALVWALTGIAFQHSDDTGLFYQALISGFFLLLFVLNKEVRKKVGRA